MAGITFHGAARRMGQVVLALALVLMIGHFLIYVHYAIGLMRFPFDYDQGEGFELVDTVMFSEGRWPYRNTEVYPFYASNYPPLFHIMLVPFVWAFGPGYWYGRLAGFIGTLITAAAIGWMVNREGKHRALAVLSGLAFLASNYVYHVGPLFRQHMTMVMFETLAVAVLAHVTEENDPKRRRRVMILGLALLLAAGFTKQLAIASCAAVFGFLFLRGPRRAIVWGVLFAAVASVLFFGIDVATHGAWWDNIIAANVNEYYPSQFVDLFAQWFRLHGVLVILAAWLVVYELYFDRLSLYSVWWVAALAITISAGKWGAGDSYFATVIAASCVLSGITASRTVRGTWTWADNYLTRRLHSLQGVLAARREGWLAAAAVVIPAVYVVYGLTVVKMPTEGALFGPLSDRLALESSYGDRYAFYDSAGWVQGYATIGHVPTRTDRENGWRIVEIVREGERPALSEEAGFSLRARKDVITNPTQLKNLYENGMYDPSTLIAAIRQHAFNAVVFRAQFYPPPVLDAIYEAYYPAQSISMNGFRYEIWRPGPSADVRQASAGVLAHAEPAEPVALAVELTPDEAEAWLAHTLSYHNWEPVQEFAPDEQDCSHATARREARHLNITLCPADVGSVLTLDID